MKVCASKQKRLLAAFNERCHSLISDGYYLLFARNTAVNSYCKLAHPNGNIVFIVAYYQSLYLSQRTNGVIVHEETFQ